MSDKATMPSKTHAAIRSSVAFDWPKARPASALQRAAVMAITLAVAGHLFGLSAAINASVAALLVGMLDKRQSPPARLKTMLAGTILLSIATYTSHQLSPWPLAVLGLLVLIAFSEGAGIAVHRDAPVVMQLSGIAVATALLEPQAPATALPAAATVLIAGTIQTAVCTLAAHRAQPVLEVEIAADAIQSIATAITLVATAGTEGEADQAAAAMEHASRAMSAAQREVQGSDLSNAERALLNSALLAADQMRIDAKAQLIESTEAEEPTAEPRGTAPSHLLVLVDVLQAGSEAIRDPATAGGHVSVPRQPDLDSGVSDPVASFTIAVSGIVAITKWQRVSTRHAGELRQRLSTGLRIGAVPFRFGIRLSLAALASGLIGSSAGLVHGSWTINAGLSVLRPDGGAALPRLVLRAGATTIAALVVLIEALVIGHSRAGLAVAAIVFATLMYWLGPANYGLYGVFVTASVLSLLTLTSSDPLAMAFARWEDTLIGCCVALAVAFVVPVWKVTQLPRDVARCCATVAQRFRDLATAAHQEHQARDVVRLRVSGIATRDSITDVLATLQISNAEPSAGVAVPALRAAFEGVRACARSGVVAERLLNHDAPRSDTAAALASETADELDRLSRALSEGTPRPAPAPVTSAPTPDGPFDDELGAALRKARQLARSASISAAPADKA